MAWLSTARVVGWLVREGPERTRLEPAVEGEWLFAWLVHSRPQRRALRSLIFMVGVGW